MFVMNEHRLILAPLDQPPVEALPSGRNDYTSSFDSRLVVQNDIQQRAMDFDAAIVLNKAQLPKFVHKETYARARGSDHLRKRLLTDLGDHRLGGASLPKFANSRTRRASRFPLELNS
jgi:hypothetical protein